MEIKKKFFEDSYNSKYRLTVCSFKRSEHWPDRFIRIGSESCSECGYCVEYNFEERFVRCIKYDGRPEVEFMYM